MAEQDTPKNENDAVENPLTAIFRTLRETGSMPSLGGLLDGVPGVFVSVETVPVEEGEDECDGSCCPAGAGAPQSASGAPQGPTGLEGHREELKRAWEGADELFPTEPHLWSIAEALMILAGRTAIPATGMVRRETLIAIVDHARAQLDLDQAR